LFSCTLKLLLLKHILDHSPHSTDNRTIPLRIAAHFVDITDPLYIQTIFVCTQPDLPTHQLRVTLSHILGNFVTLAHPTSAILGSFSFFQLVEYSKLCFHLGRLGSSQTHSN
jgi:hypothetical protein